LKKERDEAIDQFNNYKAKYSKLKQEYIELQREKDKDKEKNKANEKEIENLRKINGRIPSDEVHYLKRENELLLTIINKLQSSNISNNQHKKTNSQRYNYSHNYLHNPNNDNDFEIPSDALNYDTSESYNANKGIEDYTYMNNEKSHYSIY